MSSDAKSALETEVARLREEADAMTLALSRNDVIGQAKGILMATYKVGADDAFEMLTAASENLGYSLWTTAQRVAATRALPPLNHRSATAQPPTPPAGG
jgi:AmiR/NasT family two-component response regulator